MSATTVRAMVQLGPGVMEMREFARPPVAEDQALIRLEACGVCGSDISIFKTSAHTSPDDFPVIRGHEPVGVIEEIGGVLARRHRLKPGDRVAVDPFLRCGSCHNCLSGRGELCTGGVGQHNTLSSIPLRVAPGLWGGFATHLMATAQTVLYPVPEHVSGTRAALFNAMGAGVKWGVDVPGTTIGSTVVVLGCGQRGMACALAALEAGAEFVAVTGLTKDADKLKLAGDLGIPLALDVEQSDVRQAILDRYPQGVEIVIDTTPVATDTLAEAVAIATTSATVVMAGLKGRLADNFPIDELTRKEISLRGVLGVGSDQYRRAISMIAHTSLPLHLLQTHVLPLDRADYAIDVLAGEVEGEHALNVVIDTA